MHTDRGKSHNDSAAGPVIGIDLGTTFCCVGCIQSDHVEIIANPQGNRKIPSIVAFTDKEYLTGVAAWNQAEVSPRNTVYDMKRLIGRRFNDTAVQDDRKRWPFKLMNSNEKPMIEVDYCGRAKQFTAEEILSLMLMEMKETAEAYLGEKVTNAVITVPANFDDSQRKATIDAGKIAGLNVMRLINEPTAAALAYGFGKPMDRKRNVLILDLGGGTCDVSIMSMRNEEVDVRAVSGDTHLGGGDFDSRLVDYCVKIFKQEHGGVDLTSNAKALARLRKACEKSKRTLALLECTRIEVESVHGDIDLSVPITQHLFEQLCSDLFERMKAIVNGALADSGLRKTDVHEILLVGGSTRILKVQQLMHELFSDSKFKKSINPDEAAAYGATLLAAGTSNKHPVKLLEVTPISLHLATSRGMITLVQRNTKIPTKPSVTDKIPDEGKHIVLRVYEGEHASPGQNKLAAEFTLPSPSSLRHSFTHFKVTFAIDENGVLNMSAVTVGAVSSESIDIEELGRSSEEEILRSAQESKRLREEKAKLRTKMATRNMLESFIFITQSELKNEEFVQKTSEEQRKHVLTLSKDVLQWLDSGQMATKEVYEDMLNKVKRACNPILEAKKNSPKHRNLEGKITNLPAD